MQIESLHKNKWNSSKKLRYYDVYIVEFLAGIFFTDLKFSFYDDDGKIQRNKDFLNDLDQGKASPLALKFNPIGKIHFLWLLF